MSWQQVIASVFHLRNFLIEAVGYQPQTPNELTLKLKDNKGHKTGKLASCRLIFNCLWGLLLAALVFGGSNQLDLLLHILSYLLPAPYRMSADKNRTAPSGIARDIANKVSATFKL